MNDRDRGPSDFNSRMFRPNPDSATGSGRGVLPGDIGVPDLGVHVEDTVLFEGRIVPRYPMPTNVYLYPAEITGGDNGDGRTH